MAHCQEIASTKANILEAEALTAGNGNDVVLAAWANNGSITLGGNDIVTVGASSAYSAMLND